MSKALVVLSGGQDSTTCAFIANQSHEEVHCLTIDYGQRHHLEIESARAIATLIGAASHEVCEVGALLKGQSFLTDFKAAIQQFDSYEEMGMANAAKEDKLDSSFVPMRNTLFLTIASNRAVVLGCDTIYTGITAADFAEYGEFSWAWLGGFVDAEGCFDRTNGDSYRLVISQSDPELLQRIGEWVKSEFPDAAYSVHRRKKELQADIYFGKKTVDLIMPVLQLHLHSPHRRRQAKLRGVAIDIEGPLYINYVAGFWEGDGSCDSQAIVTNGKNKSYTTHAFRFSFFQKDPEVLEKIHDFLNSGTVYQHKNQNKIWEFVTSDGPVSAKLLRRMAPHLNVLNSFAKISKARLRIGFEAGGFNPPYPDCSPDFLSQFAVAVNESLRSPSNQGVKIKAPLLYKTKAQSIWLAETIPGALESLAYSHTCYAGQYPPCGRCHACLLRQYGFEMAKLPDPLLVRAYKEDALPVLPATPNYDAVR